MSGVRIPVRCVEPDCSSETTIDVATGQDPYAPRGWDQNELGFWCPIHPPRRLTCTCAEGPEVIQHLQHRCSRCSNFIDNSVSNRREAFDPVDRPSHYADRQIEVIDFIEDSGWGEGFCLGNAVKYIARAGKKDPEKKIQDLEKARWYLNRFIEKGKP